MPRLPFEVQSRLPAVGTTIFTRMSRLAQECGAINLSQGFPDFEADPELFARVQHWMRAGANQYAPMPGLPALRAVAFNGQTAWKARRPLEGMPLQLLALPSSSPAYTRPFADTLAAWRQLADWL